jgi:hypothetical protein
MEESRSSSLMSSKSELNILEQQPEEQARHLFSKNNK